MPRLDETAKGVFVIAPTPFREDGALDEAARVDAASRGFIDWDVVGFASGAFENHPVRLFCFMLFDCCFCFAGGITERGQ